MYRPGVYLLVGIAVKTGWSIYSDCEAVCISETKKRSEWMNVQICVGG